MPASVQIADDDVHNHPGITAISDDDVHNHPSSDRTDPTPLVSTSQIDPNDVPEYERDAASGVSLDNQGSHPESDSVAHVDSGPLASRKVTVEDSSAYSAADQAHELQHIVQNDDTSFAQKLANQLDPSHATMAGVTSGATGAQAPYDYGGTEGLDKHLKSGKTVADLNAEQQASIPQNYMKEYNKAVKAGDAKAIDRLNEVYQPAIKQLRNMADKSKTTINTTPDAPAGAPAELLGSAKPVKGMASNSTKSAVLPTQPAPAKAIKKASWSAAAASALGRK
jgi:hypothetical protein